MIDTDLLELSQIGDRYDDDPHEYIATAECRKRTIHALRSMRGSAKVYEKLVALRSGIQSVDEFGDPVATDLLIEHAIVIEELDPDMVHSVAGLAFHDEYEARTRQQEKVVGAPTDNVSTIKAQHGNSRDVAKLAGQLLRRYVDPHVALELITAWNTVRCSSPLSEDEVTAIVNRIAGKELKRRSAS